MNGSLSASEPSGDRPPLLAFCGIDGSGKSTLIEALKDWGPLRGAPSFKKTIRSNVERLVRLHPTRAEAPESYLVGSFARALRWANAFDVLSHYVEVVAPALNGPRPLLLDRWTPCTLAWSLMVPGVLPEVRELLRPIPGPDLVLYLDVKPEEALRRIDARGSRTRDEKPEVLRALYDAYDSILDTLDVPVHRIGRGSPDDTLGRAKDILAEFLPLAIAP